MLAPAIGTASEINQTSQTLVESQRGGPGWHECGIASTSSTVRTLRDVNRVLIAIFNVTQTENGTVLAGFMDSGYASCGSDESPCTRTGFRVIDPGKDLQVLSGYSFPVRTNKNSVVHDVERLESGEYLVTDMEYKRIFTVKNGEVTWQWNASSFYDAPQDPTTTDWLHINDVDVISTGRYLVSVRNANQLLVIKRGEGVVDVNNKDTTDSNETNCHISCQLADYDSDGDIRCGDPDVLNHQHNPQWLGDDAVLVADSEHDWVVELHRTENGSVEPAWTLDRAGGITFNWPQDADHLPNGNTLITDTLNRRFVEVNESGKVVWSVQTERIPYEAGRLPVGESGEGPGTRVMEVALEVSIKTCRLSHCCS